MRRTGSAAFFYVCPHTEGVPEGGPGVRQGKAVTGFPEKTNENKETRRLSGSL